MWLFFETVACIIKDAIELVTVIAGESAEFLINGTKEILINGNSNYKTSYQMRSEADAIRQSILHEFNSKIKTVEEKFTLVTKQHKNLYDMKLEMLKELGVISFDIIPQESDTINLNHSTPIIYFDETDFQFCSNILTNVLFMKQRRDLAKQYLEDAEDYEIKMKIKIVQLDNILLHIQHIKNMLDEENEILNNLWKLNNKKFNKAELKKHIMCMTRNFILQCDGTFNKKYYDSISYIKNLSHNLT